MQCPKCSYISFKLQKACGACGFKYKKNQKVSSLSVKEAFSIFNSPPLTKGKKVQEEKEDSIGLLKTTKPESFIDSHTGDFKLDLPTIVGDEIKKVQTSLDLDKEVPKYETLGFDPNPDICFKEMEVGSFGLEPFQSTEEKKAEKTESGEIEPSAIRDVKKSNETHYLEPELEIAAPEKQPVLSTEPLLEIPESEEEPKNPELDLGDNEVKLDLSNETSPLNEPDPIANPSDFPELNLEVAVSDAPLINQKKIPEIEIENLGLELEYPDESEKDKS